MATRPRRSTRAAQLAAALLLLLGAVATPRSTTAQSDDAGVGTITGGFTITNPFILSIASQPYVLLRDMTAYVERDRDLLAPLRSQVIAPFEGNLAEGATFALNLPVAPQGTTNDVDQGDGGGDGLQLYSVDFWLNLFDDPFVGPAEAGGGWGTELSSLVVTPGAGEVVGGTVVVWAPDGDQRFSTDLGPDGFLLTDDDPTGPVPAGWTVLDLNQSPFRQVRTAEAEVEIVEGDDLFVDLSDRTFTDAFDTLLDELEVRYPYTVEKGIDFPALRAEYEPRVREAEEADDLLAFNVALVEFGLEFPDGHVGGSIPPEYIAETIGGRFGMRLAETDEGEVIVISVTEGLPADEVGIELGAVVSTWDGRPTTAAVADEQPIFTASSANSRRLDQYAFLTRGTLGDAVAVTFANPGGEAQTVDLTFSEDIEGRDTAANTAVSAGSLEPGQLPVDARLLDSGAGYVAVPTFAADPVMMSMAWNTALTTLRDSGATGLIVDVRDNRGGLAETALYMAGSFYDERFELLRTVYNDDRGVGIDVGGYDVVPSLVQWDLPVAVVLDEGCVSACEYFAAGMAEDPDHLLVGYHPTAGLEAGVQLWGMPGGIDFQASVIRSYRDGAVFLEGIGVAPNVEVPITADNLLDPEDEVLAAAEEALGPAIEAAVADAEAAAAEAEAAAQAEASPSAEEPVGDAPSDATPLSGEATPEPVDDLVPATPDA